MRQRVTATRPAMMQYKSRSPFTMPWPAIAIAFRNTAAALAALAAAESLQLECPYWAAMTALIVIQPTRGLLFEKSLFRLIGTAIGSVAGLLLLQQTGSPMVLTLALSLWIAGCVGVGNLLHGLRSYACMLAGFTGAVIAMSGFLNPPHLYSLAFGRIADVVVGIIVATAVTAVFTPNQSRDELTCRLNRVSGEAVTWLALLLRQGRVERLVRVERDILIEIAEIEGLLDVVGAGSLQFKKQKRRIRNLIASLLSLLAVGRLAAESLAWHHDSDKQHAYWRGLLAQHMDEVAVSLASSKNVNCLTQITTTAAEAKAHLPLLGETLGELVHSLQLVLTSSDSMAMSLDGQSMEGLGRHRDWRQAGRAAIRAALAIAAVGITWSTTGWTQGPMMLMAMSIMLSIFSSKEHPVAFVGQILIGTAIGSTIAVFCRIVLLPPFTDPLLTGLILAPFLLLGVFAMTQRRTAIYATDATLFFIFITQPGVSVAVVPYDLALGAIAMVMGVGGAWLAYRYLVPINPAIRMQSLLGAIARDIEALALAGSPAKQKRLQVRSQHHVIRLVTMATQYDGGHLKLVEGGLAGLAICRGIQRLHEVQIGDNMSPVAARLIRDALHSLSSLARNPQDVLPLQEEASIASHWIRNTSVEDNQAADRVVIDTLRDATSLFNGNALFLDRWRMPCHS